MARHYSGYNSLTASSDARYNNPMKIRHVDHVGINVENLETAKVFFTDLGFSVMGEQKMQGKLLDEVTGLKDAKTEFVMLQAPDGQICLEIIKYLQPVDPEGIRPASANKLGMQHIALQVDDLDSIVKTLQQKGHSLVGSVQNYENIWKLCYVHGPEGIILELAERIGK
jgi:catechol 2,3-dioxygenase-like lactoylglutathione lyase family enzyme